ncbi:MAG: DotI/IcmL/TraM family protein [Micavibrio sp.]
MDSGLIDKIRLYFTENLFRLVAVGALAGFIGVFIYAVKIDGNNPPPADMIFPAQPITGRPSIQTESSSPLQSQNYSSREIASRFSGIVAEALSFTHDNLAANSAAMERYFTPSGYRQYREFLSNSGFATNLADKSLQSGAYLEAEPLEINRGVFGGVFKWAFEVPVTISFTPRDTDTYRNDPARPQNRRITLRAQFTRVQNPQNPDDVRIEIWQALAPRPVRR